MDKDARSKAERIFLGAMGKISNIKIGQMVGAHPITVGNWKKQDNWIGKLPETPTKNAPAASSPASAETARAAKPSAEAKRPAAAKPKATAKPKAAAKPAAMEKDQAAATPRKRTRKSPGVYQAARSEALKVYLEAGGKISNEALARQFGVSSAAIVSWKSSDAWKEKLAMQPKPQAATVERSEVAVAVSAVEQMLEDAIEIDVDALTNPDHITLLNKQIDEILGRGHLSPTDLKTVAEAKEAVLRVVIAFLEIAEMTTEEE